MVPVIFSTFFTSLRIPNPEMTSMAPRMVSQAPTTRANVSIESNGYASTTKPAMTLIDPKTIAHPRPGNRWDADRRCRDKHTADDESDRNPDGEQENCVPLTEVTKRQDPKGDRHHSANHAQKPAAARDGQAEREEHQRDARHHQVHTKNTAAATTDGCGQARITTPSTTAKRPEKIADVEMPRIRFEV